MCQLHVRHSVETQLVTSNGCFYKYNARADFHHMNLSDEAANADTMAAHKLQIRDRKQRTDIGKYSFVNRTIKNWNQLPAEALGTFSYKPKIFRNVVRKAIINGMK